MAIEHGAKENNGLSIVLSCSHVSDAEPGSSVDSPNVLGLKQWCRWFVYRTLTISLRCFLVIIETELIPFSLLSVT